MCRRYHIVALIIVTASTIPIRGAVRAAESKLETPSVAASLVPLKKGKLPKIVTAYGTVGTSAQSNRTLTAPVSGVVTEVAVKPGSEVQAGAALIKLGPSPGTAAAYARAAAALNAAQVYSQRTKQLFDKQTATRQEVVNAEKSVSDAQTALDALKAEGGSGPQTLRAPFNAIVTAIPVKAGVFVRQGTALMMLVRPGGLVLNAGVVPGMAGTVKPGEHADVKPLDGVTAAQGEVTLRGAVVDSHTGLVPVEISLPKDRFLPGQTAQAKIQVAQVTGYVVPHQAILVNGSGQTYVVQSQHLIAKEVPVKVLLSAGDKDVIAGGLDPSALLVLAGNYQLQNGGRIRMANPKLAVAR